MTGSEVSYSSVRGPHFERTLAAHIKELPKRGREPAIAFFLDVLEEIRANPLRIQGHTNGAIEKAKPETWPGPTLAGQRKGTLDLTNWIFSKVYIDLPHAHGAARKGRIMFAVDKEACVIYLLMFYTHAQYGGRPDDVFLDRVMKEAGVPSRKA